MPKLLGMPKLLFAVLPLLFAAASPAHAHPFDDLSAAEVKAVVELVRASGKFPGELRFPVLKRQEPRKADWLAGRANDQRQAYVAVFQVKEALFSEAIVDLAHKRLLSTRPLPGLKPPVLLEELERARAIVKESQAWQEAVKKRGLALDEVFVDVWAPGLMSREELKPGSRLLRCLTYVKRQGRNFYSRPLEGFVVTVDVAKNRVASVWDVESPKPADGIKDLDDKAQARLDPPLKPLVQKMPEGSNLKVNGQELQWDRWKLRWSMDPLRGLEILHVRYLDRSGEKEEERSVLYKLSLAEMLVPYGDPAKTWSFRNAFDVGEYGLGKTLHPLVPGQDVPEHALLFDVAVPDDLGGEPVVMKGAAAYERDSGILWKHRNSENGEVDMRRGRELVLTFMTTIGNYDYGVNYIFGQDGKIKVDAQLTGILLAKGTSLERNPCADGCVPLVERRVLAPQHQHFFNFRVDLDVDGANGNRAQELNVAALPKGKGNPDGNAFALTNTTLRTEKSARRSLNLATARKWKISNPSRRNALGHPTGYALFPGENSVPYLHPTSQMRARARFVEHHAWFTVYKDEEMSGAATYPTTAPAGEGLPRYVADDEALDGKDIVLWYTFGVTHVPHPEEWPIMNTHHTGFTLVPVNFHSENPAMSVPAPR